MVTFALLLILAWQFYIGFRRGLALQGFYFLGSLISLFVASLYYRRLADWLYLWVPYASPAEGAKTVFFDQNNIFDLDQVFYAGSAFLAVYLLTYGLVRLLGIFFHLTDLDTLDIGYSRIGAGVLSVLVTWIGLEMVVMILTTIPIAMVQERITGSWLVKLMLHTPIVSQFLKNLWVTKVIGG
ncbi:CvpA family protein [Streptococcus ovuberis]|uniref:CvpA family protein n=1 Tax=Streptococcus ovuberis TaxID=1936207 RepID=A0A7X6S0X7_9STRE|nr:CvpA family protein [Streptococcus ovuberis]NKZ19576.1 CvpA family protein [Streptococcus ovuberis]